MAVEAAKWRRALGELGFATYTVAGSGPVDVTVPGLAIGADGPPGTREVAEALAGADLVIVENLLSLPLNQPAWDAVAATLVGRAAILHHHDLAWQRAAFADHVGPPDDPGWRHVTINELSRRQLADRGIEAVCIHNSFVIPAPTDGPAGAPWPRRTHGGRAVRRALGVGPTDRLVLQPTRALARKNIAGALAAAAALGATYWLLGPAEDGYGPELDRLLAGATCPVVHGVPGAPSSPDPGVAGDTDRSMVMDMADAYAASDVVALPSTWEGFGNPSLESVTHRRPLIIGPYPVASELAAFGFEWFGLEDMAGLNAWLADPEEGLLERNLAVARAHFDVARLAGRIAAVLPPI